MERETQFKYTLQKALKQSINYNDNTDDNS